MQKSRGNSPSISPGLRRLRDLNWDFHDADTLYLTHGLHPYPAKFIPQIADTLITELSSDGDTVADIFCGSGTVLVEAMRLGRNAVGVDANPLACLITEAKTRRVDDQELSSLSRLAERAEAAGSSIRMHISGSLFGSETFVSSGWRPADDVVNFWFEPFVVEELAEALVWCKELEDESAKKLAMTAFSSIVVQVSKQDSDTRYVRREKGLSPGDAFLRFASALRRVTEMTRSFRENVNANVHGVVHYADLLAHPNISKVDLVVCSPPYPNAYSYHLYHRTRMLWLGMDQLGFKKAEIGSHRKYSNKGPNGATEETFADEMRSVFAWLGDVLKHGKYACFVIGDSIIKGKKVDNAEILIDAAASCGFLMLESIEREIMATRKAFNPKIGKIKSERILIFRNERCDRE